MYQYTLVQKGKSLPLRFQPLIKSLLDAPGHSSLFFLAVPYEAVLEFWRHRDVDSDVLIFVWFLWICHKLPPPRTFYSLSKRACWKTLRKETNRQILIFPIKRRFLCKTVPFGTHPRILWSHPNLVFKTAEEFIKIPQFLKFCGKRIQVSSQFCLINVLIW